MFSLPLSHDNRRLYLPVVVLTASMYAEVVVRKKTSESFTIRRGLVDTGATSSCLTTKVIQELSLPPVSQMQVTGVSGTRTHNACSFWLGIAYGSDDPALDMSRNLDEGASGKSPLYVFHQEIVGPEVSDASDHEIIVGMDIITKGLLTVYKDRAQFQTPFHPEAD